MTPRIRWFCDFPHSPRRLATSIALDEPISVIPQDIYGATGITVDFNLPLWAGRENQVPQWRGMPCKLGVATIVLGNGFHRVPSGGYAAQTLKILVRVPDQDPICPPQTILLGNEFFIHYGTHLHLRFGVLHIATWPPAADYTLGEFVFP